MDFQFFITNNSSGHKTKEKWLSKNHPELYQKILDYTFGVSLELSFKEKIWFYYNNLKERPKCLSCGNDIKFRERFDKPYGEFCSLTCINTNKDEMIKRQTKTFNDKYGVDFYTQHKDFVKKQRKTKLEKYGNENFNNSEKNKETKLLKYGNPLFNNYEKYKETCILKYGTDNYSKSNNYSKKIKEKFKTIYPDLNLEKVDKEFVQLKCNDCGESNTISKQLLYERYKRNYVVCTKCNPIGHKSRSGYEKEICNFLIENNIEFIPNKKFKNSKTEIDIFIPEINLGIEVNGVYWHNELFKNSNYHLNKTLKAESEDINLIHIFEDEWLYKKDIVKSILKNRLKLSGKILYGRKCEIRELDSKTTQDFLNQNHIQGNVNSKYRIGLFNDNQLVSVMTFGNGRIMMGGKSNEFELTRFCNLINCNVIGSASKLLNFFIKKYRPQKIVSYSDVRLFNGELYNKLNFKKIHQSKPSYWYVIDDIRHNRFNYRKSILVKHGFDKNKTEKEIMFERKIYRIYDCGNIRWELTPTYNL
jgi:hypothetical protein